MMVREISSTKWGRTFVDVRLYADYLECWHNYMLDKKKRKIPCGVSHTVYPDGRVKEYG
jgi:hypothetical protein